MFCRKEADRNKTTRKTLPGPLSHTGRYGFLRVARDNGIALVMRCAFTRTSIVDRKIAEQTSTKKDAQNKTRCGRHCVRIRRHNYVDITPRVQRRMYHILPGSIVIYFPAPTNCSVATHYGSLQIEQSCRRLRDETFHNTGNKLRCCKCFYLVTIHNICTNYISNTIISTLIRLYTIVNIIIG